MPGPRIVIVAPASLVPDRTVWSPWLISLTSAAGCVTASVGGLAKPAGWRGVDPGEDAPGGVRAAATTRPGVNVRPPRGASRAGGTMTTGSLAWLAPYSPRYCSRTASG